MIISEKQIMQLMDIAQEYAIKLSENLHTGLHAKFIASLIRQIKDQQSEELKVIE